MPPSSIDSTSLLMTCQLTSPSTNFCHPASYVPVCSLPSLSPFITGPFSCVAVPRDSFYPLPLCLTLFCPMPHPSLTLFILYLCPSLTTFIPRPHPSLTPACPSYLLS